VSFGVLALAAGLGAGVAIAMSATWWAGSAQFAATSIFATGGGAASAILAALLLNARYAAMSASLAPSLPGSVARRAAESLALVDESWALAARGGGRFDRERLVIVALALYVAWLGGTIAGVLAGDIVGDPKRLGLDAAFPALFLALLVPQVRSRRAVGAAVGAAALALVLVPFVPAGVPILAAATIALVGLARA